MRRGGVWWHHSSIKSGYEVGAKEQLVHIAYSGGNKPVLGPREPIGVSLGVWSPPELQILAQILPEVESCQAN